MAATVGLDGEGGGRGPAAAAGVGVDSFSFAAVVLVAGLRAPALKLFALSMRDSGCSSVTIQQPFVALAGASTYAGFGRVPRASEFSLLRLPRPRRAPPVATAPPGSDPGAAFVPRLCVYDRAARGTL